MLSDFLLQFKNDISFFNLFEYLTFKTAISAITALIISFIIGPIIIKKHKIGFSDFSLYGPFWWIIASKILMSIPRRKDLDRILQTNSPRCPSCTDEDFHFSCMRIEYIFLRTIYFQKTTFIYFSKTCRSPKFSQLDLAK